MCQQALRLSIGQTRALIGDRRRFIPADQRQVNRREQSLNLLPRKKAVVSRIACIEPRLNRDRTAIEPHCIVG